MLPKFIFSNGYSNVICLNIVISSYKESNLRKQIIARC